MKDLFDSYNRELIHSTPGVRTDLFHRRLDEVKITDFFGNVQSIELEEQGQLIDQDLLAEHKIATPVLENESIPLIKKDTEIGNHGFEVRLQEGNLWMKTVAVVACVLLWIMAKRI
jgi:glycosylphosphatidylinositol transamidase (GPIT) subunit GPI8